MIWVAIALLVAFPFVVGLTVLVDWVVADLYFYRKWLSEYPKE